MGTAIDMKLFERVFRTSCTRVVLGWCQAQDRHQYQAMLGTEKLRGTWSLLRWV